MARIDCPNCHKTLALDETKLPMRESTFPCPTCKVKITVDPRRLADGVPAKTHPTPTTSAGVTANGGDRADRTSVVTTECTACRTTLEIEQASLSPRDPTVLKCPSCGAKVSVDKRKLLAAPPVVRVATKTYQPLPTAPPPEQLQDAAEMGQYVAILSDMCSVAERYLEDRIEIDARANGLYDAVRRGDAALEAIAVTAPPATDRYIKEVADQPELRTADSALQTESWYLHHVRGVCESAVRLQPRLRAPMRYTPAVEWQRSTQRTLAQAYEAAACRSPQLAASLEQLRTAERNYADVLTSHQKDKKTIEEQLTSHTAFMAKLTTDIAAAEHEVEQLEKSATANGMNYITGGGGCGAGIVAAVIATIIGAAASSGAVGFVLFIFIGVAGIALAYQMGYGKSNSERLQASHRLATLRADDNQACARNASLRSLLADHIDMAPDSIVKTIPVTAWSPIHTTEFDEKPTPAGDSASRRTKSTAAEPRVTNAAR